MKTLTTIFSFAFLILIVGGSWTMQRWMSTLVSNADQVIGTLARYYPPAGALAKAAGGNWLSLLWFLLWLLVPYLIIISFLSHFYRPLLAYFQAKGSGHTAKINLHHEKVRSPFSALLRKEAKRYFSSTLYLTNTAFGMILLLAAAVASLFVSPLALLGENEVMSVLPTSISVVGAAGLLLFVISMSNTACSSISLEGKTLWQLRVIPVDTKAVFQAKLALNYLLIFPIMTVSVILLSIGLSLSFAEGIALFLIAAATGAMCPMIGLMANLWYPKFNFENDAQVVKQSLAAMLGMFGGIIVCIPMMIVMVILSTFLPILVPALLFVVYDGIFIALCWLYLSTAGRKKFEHFTA
jgi:ABC-2 type transport system permease protein